MPFAAIAYELSFMPMPKLGLIYDDGARLLGRPSIPDGKAGIRCDGQHISNILGRMDEAEIPHVSFITAEGSGSGM
jgi:hypothetical protein